MAAHLRVYPSEESVDLESPPATVRMRLGDLLPLIALAQPLGETDASALNGIRLPIAVG